MGRRLMRVAVAGCFLAVALAACSPDEAAAPPGATLGTAPPVTPTTDPYAVPPVIDAAYVNRVLEGLDAANGDVLRMVVRTKTIEPEAVDRLKALYSDKDLMQLQIDILQSDLRRGLSGIRPDPGNQRTTVKELITSKPSCLYAKVDRDSSQVATNPNPDLRTIWISLVPRNPAKDASRYNPTPWAFRYEGFQRDLSPPPIDPCAGI